MGLPTILPTEAVDKLKQQTTVTAAAVRIFISKNKAFNKNSSPSHRYVIYGVISFEKNSSNSNSQQVTAEKSCRLR